MSDTRTSNSFGPLKCCGLERRERVPANVALARIVEEMERFDAEEAAKTASTQETGRDERCPHGYVISDTTHQCQKCGPV